MPLRTIRDRLLDLSVGLLALLAFILPIAVLTLMVVRGWEAVSLEFLTQAAQNFGAEGGIVYQLLGSLLLVSGAVVLAGPVGWSVAVFQDAYVPGRLLKKGVDLLLYTLNGVPSILFGFFGYMYFVRTLGLGLCWLSGVLILALMILPTVALSVAEGLVTLSREQREAAQALGLNTWQVVRAVLWPASRLPLLTGLALGITRAAGETAPILLTAAVFSGITWPQSLRDPVVTLPTHILTLAQEAADPLAVRNAWGASLVLVVLVGMFGALSFYGRRRMQRERIG